MSDRSDELMQIRERRGAGVLSPDENALAERIIELEAALTAIIYASHGCLGHRGCDHSTEPWQRARRLIKMDGSRTHQGHQAGVESGAMSRINREFDGACNRGGRPRETGERIGDTCGRRLPKRFEPLTITPTTTVEDIQRHSREQMREDRCLGILIAE